MIPITIILGSISMAFIIVAWAINSKYYKLSQIFALIANIDYIFYGLSYIYFPETLGAIPIIVLGVILSFINAYNIRKAPKKERKETWTPEEDVLR